MDAGCKKAHLVDQSGSATITLWGEWIDVMQHGNSYIFQHVRVRERNSERQLYTALYGVSITATEPLENINFPQEKTIANSKIVAVSNLSTKITCISCNGHIIIPTSNTEEMAQCVHCNTTLLIDFCKKIKSTNVLMPRW